MISLSGFPALSTELENYFQKEGRAQELIEDFWRFSWTLPADLRSRVTG
jgi:hypothetical protein